MNEYKQAKQNIKSDRNDLNLRKIFESVVVFMPMSLIH